MDWASSVKIPVSCAKNGSKFDSSICTPLAPVATKTTASLVEVSPSTVIRLKDLPLAFLRAACNSSSSIAASVATKPNIVAIFGLIIPEPLQIPVIVTCDPLISHCIEAPLERVSVVKIPSAASCQPSTARFSCAEGIALQMVSTGKGSPITPVEKGSICCISTDAASATAWQQLSVSAIP